ncbi:zinc-ribbon domain [Bifidobacterium boum]|uniref:Zinc-ribbon domain n=3 Tax=Bifidobacterium boum TaxID=78343 RepID=A0A086ZRD2_9BIFI|nr:zinc-ribbon domain [Bifidobacterium boum]
MYCPQCGNVVAEGAKFCNQCGKPLAHHQEHAVQPTMTQSVSGADTPHQPVPAPAVPQAPAPTPTSSVAMSDVMPNQATPATAPAIPQPIMGMPPLPQPHHPTPVATQPLHSPAPAMPASSQPTVELPTPGIANPMQQFNASGSSTPTMPQPPSAQPVVPQAPPQYIQQPVQPIDMENLARSGGAGLGIGVGAAFVTSVITAILALAVSSSVLDQITDTFNAFGSLSPDNLFGNTRDMNILQSIIFFMVQGVAGGFSITYQGDGFFSSSSTGSAWLGAGLSGFALLLGTAFGVYLLGRKNTIHLRWMGVASSAVVGVAAGIVYEILGLIGRIQISTITVSGTSVRTFFMAFLFAGGGALIGYALAQITPDASNVFTALHLWFHRARGFVRTVIETLLVFGILAFVIALVLYAYVAIRSGEAVSILLFPAILPMIAGFLFSFGSLGAIAVYGEAAGASVGLLGSSGEFASVSGGLGWFWLYVLVVVVATLYLGLREAARNMYDPAYAGWQHAWKAPLTAGLFWLVYAFAALSVGGTAQGHSVFAMPAMWSCLIVALWSFLVEVVALTFGQSVIVSVPKLWKFVVGGTVQPTPKEVLEYNRAMNQRSSNPSMPAAAVSGGASPSVPSSVASIAPNGNGQNGNAANGSQVFQAAVPMAAPANPTAPGVPGAAAAQPMSPNAKKAMVIAGIAVGALVVVAVAIGVLSSTVFNPKNAANAYLSQLSSGDYDAASKTVDPGIDTNRRALLTSAVSANGKNALSSPKIDSVSANGSEAVAQIEYSVHGTTTKDTLTLRKDGNTMLFFPKWVVSKPLLSTIVVEDSGAADTVLVNNVKVSKRNADPNSSSGALMFTVYPGTYTVSLPKSEYLTASAVTKYVTGGSSKSAVEAQLDVKATDKLVSAINDAIKTKMGKCGKVNDASSKACVLNEHIYNTDSKRNMSWTVTKFPTVSKQDIGITASGISFRTDYGDGKATLTYEEQDWFDENTWTPQTQDYSFSLSGTVTVDDGKPEVSFGD